MIGENRFTITKVIYLWSAMNMSKLTVVSYLYDTTVFNQVFWVLLVNFYCLQSLQLFFMRKSGLSSGFLKLGCYCSRILIHILSFSNTRLQQQTMAGITQCSKMLIRILSFSNTRLQQQAMVGITQRSKILIRILPFCNTRLQQ